MAKSDVRLKQSGEVLGPRSVTIISSSADSVACRELGWDGGKTRGPMAWWAEPPPSKFYLFRIHCLKMPWALTSVLTPMSQLGPLEGASRAANRVRTRSSSRRSVLEERLVDQGAEWKTGRVRLSMDHTTKYFLWEGHGV